MGPRKAGKAAQEPVNRKSGDLPSTFRAPFPGRGVPGRDL